MPDDIYDFWELTHESAVPYDDRYGFLPDAMVWTPELPTLDDDHA